MGFSVDVAPITRSEIEDRLRSFEATYARPSADFVLAFRNGELRETEDFLDWATLYSAWEIAGR